MDRQRIVIAYVVTIVWAILVIGAFVYPDRSVPFEVHGIMGLVAGFLFGKERFDAVIRKMGKNGD